MQGIRAVNVRSTDTASDELIANSVNDRYDWGFCDLVSLTKLTKFTPRVFFC